MTQDITKITIGIQARSSSTRFPRKVHEYIGGVTILKHTIDACNSAAEFLNQRLYGRGYKINVAVCIPEGDEIAAKYKGIVDIVEGSETDVLSRYLVLAEHFSSNSIVRITSDCPLIIPKIIGDHVLTAINKGYDYFSNVDEDCRTSIDGMDCEVISYRLLKYIAEHAIDHKDREHVTTYIRRELPPFASIGVSINHIDHSEMKLSVDTPEDLKRITDTRNRTTDKHRIAIDKYGKFKVHWL